MQTWISSRYNYKPPKSKFSNILFICFDLVQLDHGRPDNEGQEFTSRKEGIPMATTSPYLLSEGFATMVARQSSKIATMYESIANPLHPRSCSMSNMSIYRSLQHDGCRYVYYILCIHTSYFLWSACFQCVSLFRSETLVSDSFTIMYPHSFSPYLWRV